MCTKCFRNRTVKFEYYKICSEATRLESLTENHKEFKTIIKILLKSSQRFRTERHVFIEEIIYIVLCSNDDK